MRAYEQRGDVINVVAGGAVAVGSVQRLNHLLGVAITAAAASGDVYTLQVEGIVRVPKVPATNILQGQKLLWDSSAGQFDGPAAVAAANDVQGGAVAIETAAASVTTVLVKLTPGNVTLS
jgi:predicted RecA/RadA family phage recombinase